MRMRRIDDVHSTAFEYDAASIKAAIFQARDKIELLKAEGLYSDFVDRYEPMANGDTEQRSCYFNTVVYLEDLLEGCRENFRR